MSELAPGPVRPPIFVFGGDFYLHIARSVKDAVKHASDHVRVGASASGFDRFEFFDVNGQQLKPLGPPDRLEGFEVTDRAQELGTSDRAERLVAAGGSRYVEDRVRRIIRKHRATLRAALPDVPENFMPLAQAMLDDQSDFSSLVRGLASRAITNSQHFGSPHSGGPMHQACHALHLPWCQ
ncbi:MAG TPA: hypothetical protein VFV02_10170 [Acidimicrobiales bacterium]|nr:hypothetical protein [Acidimicrobiales bacterium]